MDTVETVKIVAPHVPGGHIVINKSDLTSEHKLYEPAVVEVEAGAADPTAAPDEPPANKPKRPYTRHQ